ncbi:putative Delta(14)-sterol reductase [Cardiosporidium cionae]|uniref:Delta(14)-sterol reductase n=1 Tax=Cardiosporidium cionae TaxID=476202 RepID=A0ABQ7JAB0_9APIC|nr:putative Delta(14)-sterol reductase [Cardiosporidium cionae]|eukprot:KAF8820943.1 putative Delta(14)-sterol reductase [Cardiosporidium cionae]
MKSAKVADERLLRRNRRQMEKEAAYSFEKRMSSLSPDSSDTAKTGNSYKKDSTPTQQTANSQRTSQSIAGKSLSTAHKDFGGVFGVCFIALLLPAWSLWISIACQSRSHCLHFYNLSDIKFTVGKWWPKTFADYWNWEAFGIVIAWQLFCAFLYIVLPGKTVKGLPIKELKGTQLKYKLNGHLQFWVTLFFLRFGNIKYDAAFGSLTFNAFPLNHLLQMYIPLMTATFAVSIILSVILYLLSFRKSTVLSHSGSTGYFLVDFFMGRELNPRGIFLFDWKVFLDLRPSLIGWTVLNVAFLIAEKDFKGYVSTPLVLVSLFQGIYTWDALLHEEALLTTMDITTEGLGFMLVFGNISWVPFMYSLQGHYLVYFNGNISYLYLLTCSLLFIEGYYIFRASNSEKDTFRRDPTNPEVKHLEYLETETGRKLLTSGWWGTARKINYTGDMLMALSWCLLAGFGSPVPFFYFFYLVILLCHRAWRDDIACRRKYGSFWTTYKKSVPYIFIPRLI